jgi:hypothetical protein
MQALSGGLDLLDRFNGEDKWQIIDSKFDALLEQEGGQHKVIMDLLTGKGAADVKPAEVNATIGQFRTTARLNVRAVPGREGQPLGKVEVGSLIMGLEERDNWIRIDFRPPLSTEVLEGWVYRPYLAKIKGDQTPKE